MGVWWLRVTRTAPVVDYHVRAILVLAWTIIFPGLRAYHGLDWFSHAINSANWYE